MFEFLINWIETFHYEAVLFIGIIESVVIQATNFKFMIVSSIVMFFIHIFYIFNQNNTHIG